MRSIIRKEGVLILVTHGIDEDTPYILLSEEVEQEYYVSEYWTDELKKNMRW